MKEIDEINERFDSNDEIINNLIKQTTELEKQKANKTDIAIPDYKSELESISRGINELKENHQIAKRQISLLNIIYEQLSKMKSVTKQYRLLLFPETNQGQYYKIVFGRLIPWGLCFMVITYIFIAGYKAIDIYRYNQDVSQSVHYEEAWLYLKQHSKKKTVAAMDDAFDKTGKK